MLYITKFVLRKLRFEINVYFQGIVQRVCIQMTSDLKLRPLYHQENLQNHSSFIVPSTSNTHICTHRHTYRSKGGKDGTHGSVEG